MKQRLLTFTLALLPLLVWADGVGRDEALRIAEHFFAQQSSRRAIKADQMHVAYTGRAGEEAAFYVVNSGDNAGFVIVSGNKDTNHPVLGWSDNGTFDYDKAPIQLREMLEAYSQASVQKKSDAGSSLSGLVTLADGRMAFPTDEEGNQGLKVIIPQPAKRAAQRRVESAPNVVVEPLVKVHWNQTGEYAKYIDPYYDSFAGVAAGCVPAAMAQIMAYWKFPARGRGFHLHNILDVPADIDMAQLAIDYASGRSEELRYVINQYSRPYKVNFAESVYKWNEMGGDHPTTDAERDNVAKLIFDCHVACAPVKTPDGRGTGSNIATAASSMIRFFGYNPDMKHIGCKGNEDLMRQELDAGRPILMDGDPTTGFSNDGHAFICDGYAEDGYFHFNFGWSGLGDGYYLMNSVRPESSDFSWNQTAYIGICPSLATSDEGNAFVNVTPDGVGIVVGGCGDVVVPATVEKDGKSYPVMKVKASAFNLPRSNYDTWFEENVNEYVKRITLPESITEIGSMAFPSRYLTEVNLGGNIRKIGANAFGYSQYLERVSIPSIEAWLNIDFEPNVLESGFAQYMSNPIWNTDNSFKGRLYIGGKEATDIVIPASIKEVKPFVFCGYQFLNSVTFEEGVEKIGASAFERVPLKKFNIPSTVKEIGVKAFYNHQASTVTIPAGLTRVGSEALSGDMISEYIVDENNPKYSAYQGILYDKSRRTLIHCPNYRPGFREDKVRTAVGVPSSVTAIRAHSFGNNLEKLTLPPSVRSIEDEAFRSTGKLKDLYLYTMPPVPITSTTFSGNATSMYNKVNVHVPAGAGDAYRAAPVWQDMNIIEDQAEGSVPPEHYDYITDFNAIEIADWDDQDQWQVAQYHYFLFDLHPVVTFSGTSMLITTEKERYVIEKEHYLRSPYRFHFRFAHYDDPTAIDDVQTIDRHAVFRTVGNQLVISGLDANTPVALYSTDGRLLVAAKASTRGEVSIGIPAVGVIVVKAGKYSFKIHAKK